MLRYMSICHGMGLIGYRAMCGKNRLTDHLVLLEFLSNLLLGVFEGHRPARGQWAFGGYARRV